MTQLTSLLIQLLQTLRPDMSISSSNKKLFGIKKGKKKTEELFAVDGLQREYIVLDEFWGQDAFFFFDCLEEQQMRNQFMSQLWCSWPQIG